MAGQTLSLDRYGAHAMSAFGVEFLELQHRRGRLAMPAGVLGIARTSIDLARLPCVLTALSLVLEWQPCHVT